MADALEDMARVEGIETLHSNPSFRPEMILHMAPSETVGEALTRQLGEGFWSEWKWSAEEAKGALVSLAKQKRLLKWAMDQFDLRERQTHGYVRGLH